MCPILPVFFSVGNSEVVYETPQASFRAFERTRDVSFGGQFRRRAVYFATPLHATGVQKACSPASAFITDPTAVVGLLALDPAFFDALYIHNDEGAVVTERIVHQAAAGYVILVLYSGCRI